jgi:hypothetical protein
MTLPKRSGPYLLTFLLLILAFLVAWMFHALTSPVVIEAASKSKKKAAKLPVETASPTLPTPNLPRGGSASAPIDPEHQKMADELHSTETQPIRDLEIVQEFLTLYSRAFKEGMPIGGNADITAALTGKADTSRPGRLFPDAHRSIRNGQLTDRWGTPFWFHPNSSNQMEIRSGGPDKEMFTLDDVILNASPAGFGATAPAGSGNQ